MENSSFFDTFSLALGGILLLANVLFCWRLIKEAGNGNKNDCRVLFNDYRMYSVGYFLLTFMTNGVYFLFFVLSKFLTVFQKIKDAFGSYNQQMDAYNSVNDQLHNFNQSMDSIVGNIGLDTPDVTLDSLGINKPEMPNVFDIIKENSSSSDFFLYICFAALLAVFIAFEIFFIVKTVGYYTMTAVRSEKTKIHS